jgi:hypothetical protein
MLNLLAVFAVSGLWHGANWTFIIWGLLHGSYVLGERYISKLKSMEISAAWWKWIKRFLVFHLVVFGWIFFRANNFEDALLMVQKIFTWAPQGELIKGEVGRLGDPGLYWKIVLVLFFIAIDPLMYKFSKNELNLGYLVKLLVLAFITACIILFGNWGEVSFIYFQF